MSKPDTMEVLAAIREGKVERIVQRTATYDVMVETGRRVTPHTKRLARAGMAEMGSDGVWRAIEQPPRTSQRSPR